MEPTSRLSPWPPRPPVMWEKPGRVSHWARSGSRPRLQTCHCDPLSRGNGQAEPSSLKIACFMSVFFFFCHVVSPCLKPNRKCHTSCSGSQWGWIAPVSRDFLLPLKKIRVNICLVILKQSREGYWLSFDSCFPALKCWFVFFFFFKLITIVSFWGFSALIFFYCFCNNQLLQSLLL